MSRLPRARARALAEGARARARGSRLILAPEPRSQGPGPWGAGSLRNMGWLSIFRKIFPARAKVTVKQSGKNRGEKVAVIASS